MTPEQRARSAAKPRVPAGKRTPSRANGRSKAETGASMAIELCRVMRGSDRLDTRFLREDFKRDAGGVHVR